MTLEEAIYKEEALAYSFGERYKRLGEPVGDLPELEAEYKQYAEWLRELQIYRKKLTEIEEAVDFYKGCESCQGFREYPTDKFVEDLVRILEVTADEEGSDSE